MIKTISFTSMENNVSNYNNEAYASQSRTNSSALKMMQYALEKYEPISPKETIHLLRIVKAGGPQAEKAHVKLVHSNLRMVMKIAINFCKNVDLTNDYFNEGVFGLNKAIDMFDLSNGTPFLAYAMRAIRTAITESYEKSERCIRLPHNVHEEISKVDRFIKAYRLENEEMPSKIEICKGTGLSMKRVKNALNIMSSNVINYDDMIGSDAGMSLLYKAGYDCYGSESGSSIEDYDRQEQIKLIIHVIAHEMNEKNAEFYKEYHELNQLGYTDKEVADILGISVATMNKRLSRIIAKLSTPEVKAIFLRHAA